MCVCVRVCVCVCAPPLVEGGGGAEGLEVLERRGARREVVQDRLDLRKNIFNILYNFK